MGSIYLEKEMRTCTKCKRELDKTEYYQRNGKYHVWCKTCLKKLNKWNGHKMVGSTKIVLDKLKELGFCVTAHIVGDIYPGADIVAWGLIPIEAKTAKDTGRHNVPSFNIGFSQTQKSINYLHGFTVLTIFVENEVRRYFVIPHTAQLIQNIRDGKHVRLSFSISENSQNYQYLLQYENRFDLIVKAVENSLPILS